MLSVAGLVDVNESESACARTIPWFCSSVKLIIDSLSPLRYFHELLMRLPSADKPGACSFYINNESHSKRASATRIYK